MNVSFVCSKCDQPGRVEFDDSTEAITCVHCGRSVKTLPKAIEKGRVHGCLLCPSQELFVRKDFSQRLGITVIALGALGSAIALFFHYIIAAYAILFACAMIDLVLYLFVGNVLECYRCHAHYRDLEGLAEHGAFDLEIHERHRQQLIRLKSAAQAPSKTHS
jgi:Zn ribbon nucleic-acid-binding protein